MNQTFIPRSAGSLCDITAWFYILIGSSFPLVGFSSMLAVFGTILFSGRNKTFLDTLSIRNKCLLQISKTTSQLHKFKQFECLTNNFKYNVKVVFPCGFRPILYQSVACACLLQQPSHSSS